MMDTKTCAWCENVISDAKASYCRNCRCDIKKFQKDGVFDLYSKDNYWKYKFRVQGKKLIAIYDCNNPIVDYLEIPEGVEEIGKSTFYYSNECRDGYIKTIVIPKSVKNVETGAFAYFDGKFIIEEGCTAVKLIDGILYSFDGKRLIKATNAVIGKDIVVPEGVEEIGKMAFYRLQPKSIKFPNSLKVIGELAFDCCRFDSLVLPDNIEKLGKEAFSSLKAVNLPKNLKQIGVLALGFHLEKMETDNENEYFKLVDGVLFSKTGKRLILMLRTKAGEDYTIPNEVTKVDEWAFCKNLSSLTVPAHLKMDDWWNLSISKKTRIIIK